jgi:ribosome-binding factor A
MTGVDGPERRTRSPRSARVAEAVREVIAEELERRDDERLGLLTITSVEVSRDLRDAVVYYTTAREDGGRLRDPTPEELASTAMALQQTLSHLLLALGRHLRLRYLPRLTFSVDDAPVVGARVEKIIRSWQSESEQGGADGEL